MKKYQILHGEGSSGEPGTITFSAASDSDAVEKLRTLVSDGLRGEAWANMDLSDGRMYGARNISGDAVGGYINR